MSKVFDTEPRLFASNTAEAMHQLQQKAQQQDAFDAETALHMELLVQTDAKLDRINARLDRLSSELNRWAQDLYEARQAPVEVSSHRRHRRGPSLLATGLLLCLAAAAGALSMAWHHGDLRVVWPWEAYDASAEPVITSWSTTPNPAPTQP